jgi:hypothetical protein
VKGKKVEEVSMRGFLRFLNGHLRVSFEAITEERPRQAPVITKDTVANAFVGATAFGSRSVRETDFLGRGPARHLWKGSDTTLLRVAAQLQGTDRVLRGLWRRLRHEGYLGFEGDRVGVVDGTSHGAQLLSVLAEIGPAPAIIATEPIPGTGNELHASIGLIERLAEEEGRFVDYLLADGLYACERYWQACDKVGCLALVKTSDDEPFALIQQARLLFDVPVRGEQVGYQYAQGLDVARACRYRIWQTSGLWADTRRRLTVARVEETFLKTARRELYWVLCQDLSIEPVKLLRLAHARWFIENNVFKAFNDQAHSKHLFSHDRHTATVITHLQMLAFVALGAYRYVLEHSSIATELWDHGRIPLRLLQSVFRLVLSPVNSS